MRLITGTYSYSESCAELLTKDLLRCGERELAYVQLNPTNKGNLARVNAILEQFGFPQVDNMTQEEIAGILAFRTFTDESWFKFSNLTSTPLFHATVRALRDGQDFEFALLEVIAEIERDYGPHWVNTSGVEMFLMTYVHPKLYAEKLFKYLDTKFLPSTKSLILLASGHGQLVQDKLREERPNWVETKTCVLDSEANTYYLTDCFQIAYKTPRAHSFRKAELPMVYPEVNGKYVGWVYYLGTDPSILDEREWLVS